MEREKQKEEIPSITSGAKNFLNTCQQHYASWPAEQWDIVWRIQAGGLTPRAPESPNKPERRRHGTESHRVLHP